MVPVPVKVMEIVSAVLPILADISTVGPISNLVARGETILQVAPPLIGVPRRELTRPIADSW